ENVKGVRIQLIDKLEDRIIDLKAIDNYTFMGSTADRKDRFTLVFTQVETGSIFAYQSGNDIIVSGDGELQVFDVMGRMVMTQHINGVGTLRAASVQTGVYILRLNGKSQKIVIK
ncbi:MAG: T9SS type A sorting domain-containing protein, partial [Bacteroidales bacterium]|nr:T9SS type A sorting domain-containing protein [Bacteroidales bacterium]